MSEGVPKKAKGAHAPPGAPRLATQSWTCAGAARRGASQRSAEECTKVAAACLLGVGVGRGSGLGLGLGLGLGIRARARA